jgi:hypothetical protein
MVRQAHHEDLILSFRRSLILSLSKDGSPGGLVLGLATMPGGTIATEGRLA